MSTPEPITIRCKVKVTRAIDAVYSNGKIVHVAEGTIGEVTEVKLSGDFGLCIYFLVAEVNTADGSRLSSDNKGRTVLSIKTEDVSALVVSEPVRRPLGPLCTARPPKVGDRVMSTELEDRHGGDPRDGDAWTLRAGEVAVVTRVSDNKFEVEGGSGQKGPPYLSSFLAISNWSYADAE